MVKIVIKNKVPTKKVKCSNCGSLLEYGNADLYIVYPESTLTVQYLCKQPYFAFKCPVCGVEVQAEWVVGVTNKNDLKEAAE